MRWVSPRRGEPWGRSRAVCVSCWTCTTRFSHHGLRVHLVEVRVFAASNVLCSSAQLGLIPGGEA